MNNFERVYPGVDYLLLLLSFQFTNIKLNFIEGFLYFCSQFKILVLLVVLALSIFFIDGDVIRYSNPL